MPSPDTLEIQNALVKLGEALGFEAIAEGSVKSKVSGQYTLHISTLLSILGAMKKIRTQE